MNIINDRIARYNEGRLTARLDRIIHGDDFVKGIISEVTPEIKATFGDYDYGYFEEVESHGKISR